MAVQAQAVGYALFDRLESFLLTHPTVANLHFNPARVQIVTSWFRRIGKALPNLQSVSGSYEMCVELARCQSTVREFHIFLASLAYLSHEGFRSLAEVTDGRNISLYLCLPHLGLDDTAPKETLFPSALAPLRSNLGGLALWTRDEEYMDILQGTSNVLMKDLHLYPLLRSIEILTQDADEEGDPTSLTLLPTGHPVLWEDIKPDLSVRGHPVLDRVKILSRGTWWSSPRQHWEYWS